MTILNILQYPDPRLRIRAKPVTAFDDALVRLVDDMAQTMYAANGIGLAAIQVNVPQRVVVMDLSAEKNELQVFVNPVLSDLTGNTESEEGCLSVPGATGLVQRAATVTINAQDIHGKPFTLPADEVLAICIQHEIDHLDGKVFVDYLSRMKQERIRKKLKKDRALASAA